MKKNLPSVCWYSLQGGRVENEDSVSVSTAGGNLTAVLADGLGGHGDGKLASSLICELLTRYGESCVRPDAQELTEAFSQANAELLTRQKNRFHMKTTAVYLWLNQHQCIWGHVGDSRLYHYYKGKLEDFTLDHSISQIEASLGRISREDIPFRKDRSCLYMALGVADTQPEVFGPLALKSGQHAFLLCSDGLWEYLTEKEIEDGLHHASSGREWLEALCQHQKERASQQCDNHSAIAIIMEVE